jgi:hypothetical protein
MKFTKLLTSTWPFDCKGLMNMDRKIIYVQNRVVMKHLILSLDEKNIIPTTWVGNHSHKFNVL